MRLADCAAALEHGDAQDAEVSTQLLDMPHMVKSLRISATVAEAATSHWALGGRAAPPECGT